MEGGRDYNVVDMSPVKMYQDYLPPYHAAIKAGSGGVMVSLPSYVRLTHAAVMGEQNRDYVTAARLAGAGLPRLMFITVLPNCMAPLIVQATLNFTSANATGR